MNKITWVTAALLFPVSLAWGDDTHHLDKTSVPDQASTPQTQAQDKGASTMPMMQDNMKKMQEQMSKLQQAKNPKEKDKLMQEHMRTMQEQGTHRSTMDELTTWTQWADKVIAF